MALRVVGISDLKTSADADDVLVTYALGSCVGVAMHDAEAGVGGLLHYLLPVSQMDRSKADVNPLMFGDRALPQLLGQLYDLGARKKRLCTILAGGAGITRKENLFGIAEKNVRIAHLFLKRNGLRIRADETGGSQPRTLYLEIGSGKVLMKSGNDSSLLMG